MRERCSKIRFVAAALEAGCQQRVPKASPRARYSRSRAIVAGERTERFGHGFIERSLGARGRGAYKPYLLAEGVAVYKLPSSKAVEKSFKLALDLETLRAVPLDPQAALKLGAPQGAAALLKHVLERSLRDA
jgi:hypothetical protein